MKSNKNSLKVIKLLYDNYTPKCELNFSNIFELMVATILSAQCTDKRVNLVTKKLFKKYPKIIDYYNANVYDFQQDIKSTGFYKNKTKSILSATKIIVEKYNSIVPDNFDDLIKLPGIGRKTANVILGTGFKIASGIVVDTHVKRLSYRIGLTKQKTPDKIEKELIKIIDKKYWIDFSHLLILHGRSICKARKPDCQNCVIEDYCKKAII
jgi:endonuclease-3